MTVKKCKKKRHARAKLLFCFLPFLDSQLSMLSAITLADGQASIHWWIYGQVGAVIDKPTVPLAASRQGFKYCTWFISSKMYRNTEDIKFEIYVKISTGTTISQEMLKQTVNKNNIHVPVGVSQVSQLVVMILLINDCYVMSLIVIISRMNFVLYRNTNYGSPQLKRTTRSTYNTLQLSVEFCLDFAFPLI